MKIKMSREESDGGLNQCSKKARQGRNENKNSEGERAAGVRDREKHGHGEGHEKLLES